MLSLPTCTIVSLVSLIFERGSIDGDTSCLFFWGLVDLAVFQVLCVLLSGEHLGDGGCESCLSVIDVSDGTHCRQ